MPDPTLVLGTTPENKTTSGPSTPVTRTIPGVGDKIGPTVADSQLDAGKLQDRIVDHGGQVGVFSPLTDAHGVPTDENARANLAKIIQSLEDEVSSLQQRNAELSVAAVRPAVKPKDFASALQNSVDQLQMQLSSTLNRVSDFAIKEFKLDANVSINVNAGGEIEYGFVPLGAKIAPEQLSRLSLTIVPLPKKPSSGAWSDSSLDLGRPLTEISGIGDDDLKKLYDNRLYTVGDLLTVGSRMRSTVELAALLKVDRDRLAGWLTKAELFTLPGISIDRAQALADCGVTDLASLGIQVPETLAAQINTRLKETDPGAQPVEAAECETWVKTAVAVLRARRGN